MTARAYTVDKGGRKRLASPKRAKLRCRVDGYEFRFVPGVEGGQPYLRMGNPYAREARDEYLGGIVGVTNIRRLRDFLTAVLSRPQRTARKEGRK